MAEFEIMKGLKAAKLEDTGHPIPLATITERGKFKKKLLKTFYSNIDLRTEILQKMREQQVAGMIVPLLDKEMSATTASVPWSFVRRVRDGFTRVLLLFDAKKIAFESFGLTEDDFVAKKDVNPAAHFINTIVEKYLRNSFEEIIADADMWELDFAEYEKTAVLLDDGAVLHSGKYKEADTQYIHAESQQPHELLGFTTSKDGKFLWGTRFKTTISS